MPKFSLGKILRFLFLGSVVLVSILIAVATDQSGGVFNFEVSATSHCSDICSNDSTCDNYCNAGEETGSTNYPCQQCINGQLYTGTYACISVTDGCSWAGCTSIITNCGSCFLDSTSSGSCDTPTPSTTPTPTPTPTPTTGSCTLSADPSSGNTPLDVAFQASIGAVSGNDICEAWDYTDSGTWTSIGCSDGGTWSSPRQGFNTYSSAGIYNAKYKVDYAGLTGICATPITVNPPPNSPPSASSVTVTEPDYCAAGPSATVTWTYSDPNSHPQSAYQVQINDTGSAWNTPVFDSGKVTSSGASYFQSGLAFNITYKARVRVWDSLDLVGNWTEQSVCNGPGCLGGGNSWKTPKHAYPAVDFTWSPFSPLANLPVNFIDDTDFFDSGGVGLQAWNWLFKAPAVTPSSTLQNPTYTYSTAGSYNVTETVSDKDGYTCARTKPLNIQRPIPIWKEVSPK